MSGIPIPTEQAAAFDTAIRERLGLDEGLIATIHNVEYSGEPYAAVEITVLIPAHEVLDMFNAAAAGESP